MMPLTRTSAVIWIAIALIVGSGTTVPTCRADVFANVPESVADGYQLVYTLPIEDQAAYNFGGAVPYTVDNSDSITAPFDRIAYYLELSTGSGTRYAYASMDAFTSDPAMIGLPVASTGAQFQRSVSNLNVLSNSRGVTDGNGFSTGNIEFWPGNYGTANSNGIPGASDSVFDTGDAPFGNGNYGSFQIHNHGENETILAYNQWGGEQTSNNSDLGIGSQATGNPDWTFALNADTYTVKNLQVLVRPSNLSIDSGLERAIFQRNAQNQADVSLGGVVVAGASEIQARATPRAGSSGLATDWVSIDTSPMDGAWQGSLQLEGGWYDIDVRSVDGMGATLEQRRVERVGVGEVFVIAGQSNSANHGNPRLAAQDDRVSAFDLNNWQHADDPQPIATDSGGSPWPALGDALAAELDVPIGFASVGWGGTRVAEWEPGAGGPAAEPLYNRLRDALEALGPNGARAVLWHQGESDNGANTSSAAYQQALENIISQSRNDAGYDVLWGIAQASFISLSNPTDTNITSAQAQTAADDPLTFVGAATDDLGGPQWRWDGIHFNELGLREHAARWFTQLLGAVEFPSLHGDFNGDGTVDTADYTLWRDNLGGDEALINNAGDGQNGVDQADYSVWAAHFGQTSPATPESVPEPNALCLALLVLALRSSLSRSNAVTR